MKEIISDIRQHIIKEYDFKSYIYVFVFTATAIFVNYKYDFETRYILSTFGQPVCMLYYSLLYAIPYYLVLLPILYFKKKTNLLRSKEFWVKSLVFLILAGVMTGFSYHIKYITGSGADAFEQNFLMRVAGNLKRFIPYVVVLYIIKYYYDRKNPNFYGLRFKGLNYRPFMILLLLMIPLAAIASFNADFQHTYPQFKFWTVFPVFGLNRGEMTAIYETTYGVDFICVELMFRGALVIGLASVLGTEVILPVTVVYVIIHFGKPVGETISSFFGGYILGVIALYRKNIMAGIIIHLGLAFTMEIAAILQHFYSN